MASTNGASVAQKAAGLVLITLAAGQFLMTLDSSVMNVSISQVAADIGTTITGIQTAITLYTLVMASLMITGGKIGSIIGRRRAFAIGLVIYGAGSLTTALAPSLTVLMIGWSFLEGIGAALIMPAIVALVAGNFSPSKRSGAYGAIAAAGAIAVAVGPLLGGAVTTFASWRWVFVGEVAVVGLILLLCGKITDAPVTGPRKPFDLPGAIISIIGLSLIVLGVLRSGEWGWISPVPGQPTILHASPVLWMLLGGLLVLAAFLAHEAARVEHDKEPLVRPALFANRQVVGGLLMFFFQFLAQAGVFFTIPLFLSVVLELSALQTGIRLLPLSAALLLSAILVPRVAPRARPRRVVRIGLLLMIAGTVVLIAGVRPSANASVVALPMLLMGFGIGALASQLGAVTVSAVSEEESPEVGGLQNTATNLGASMGTALAGAVLIANLSSSILGGVATDPKVSAELKKQAPVAIANNVSFVSDTQLTKALDRAGVPPEEADRIVAINEDARVTALDAALSTIALLEVVALALTGMVRRDPIVDTEAPQESIAAGR